MPSLEEMTIWSTEDLNRQIQLSLPSGWTMRSASEGGIYSATVLDQTGEAQWHGQRTDYRLLQLDVYGWLITRGAKSQNPAWARRDNLTPKRVGRDIGLGGPSIPDPEDLDPEEVRAVYEKHKH